MKKIKNFLFVERIDRGTKETSTVVINIDSIDSVTCESNKEVGEIALIETNVALITVKNPNNSFFTEFEEILKNNEEWL